MAMDHRGIIPSIKGTTSLIGIIGHPLRHTLSPLIHNLALECLGLDFCYVPFDVEPGSLAKAVAGLRALGLKGVNVTIPHKESIIPLLDEVSDEARVLGAVNTIHISGQSACGHNTDARGFLSSWDEEAVVALQDARALVLGAGGSARAIYHALASREIRGLCLCSRSKERSAALHAHFSSLFPGLERDIVTFSDEAGIRKAIERSHVVINCTPLGMAPHIDGSPLPFPEALRKDAIICDLIYNPAETRLLRECRAQGIRCFNGLGMLLHQAALSFRLWTGRDFPMALVRSHFQENLNGQRTS
jgi:shikimate dehydrogenase